MTAPGPVGRGVGAATVRETVHRFGDGQVGVLTQPAATACDAGFVLLNAGLVGRAGPYRGYVQLARALAEQGIAVLRVDQTGLGDSMLSRRTVNERRRVEADAAIELIASHTGLRRVVLAGICSGADEAFHMSADTRVAGLVLIDGLGYRTPGFWLRYLVPRLLNPFKVWARLRRGRNAAGINDYRDFPPRRDAAAQFAALVHRDARILFLFTGGAYRYFNHRKQLAASFGQAAQAPQVSLELWPECDHTFLLRRDRARMRSAIGEWMHAQFGRESR